MDKFRNILPAAIGLAAMMGVFVLGTQHPAASITGAPVPVQVANPTPIVTVDAGLVQKPLVQVNINVNIANGNSSGTDNGNVGPGTQTYAVPAGKRLIIETVSAYRSGGSIGTSSAQIFMNTSVNGVYAAYAVPLMPATSANFSGSTQAMRIYADPGTEVLANAYRSNTTGSETDTVAISGYLVDAP